MRRARNNQDEFENEITEGGESSSQVINAESVEIKDEKKSESIAQEPSNPYMTGVLDEKTYTQGAPIDPNLANMPIEEPVFIPPPPPPPVSEPAGPPPPPVNPALKDLNPKDKNVAAKRAAEMALQMYEYIHELGNKAITIPESKLNKLQKQALIDLETPMMFNGQQITMKQFIEVFNQQAEGTFKVSQKFKDEVMPLLIEIFEKKGIGMTTEQQLMFLVGKDIAGKLSLAWVAIQQRKEMIEVMKEQTEAFKAQAEQYKAWMHAQQSTPPPPPPPPPAAEQPVPVPPPPPPPTPNFPGSYQDSQPVVHFNQDDVMLPDPEEHRGVPGELNAQGFVENMINPGKAKRNTVKLPDNSTVLTGKSRGKNKLKVK